MTVLELRNILANYRDDEEVWVRTFETGYLEEVEGVADEHGPVLVCGPVGEEDDDAEV